MKLAVTIKLPGKTIPDNKDKSDFFKKTFLS